MPAIPETWEANIGSYKVQGQSGQKIRESLSQSTSQVWWCMPVILAMQEAIGRKIMVQGWLGANM
jgi:hypothetical protein